MLFGFLFFVASTSSAQTIQTFSGSGSWVCPYGVSSVTVETWGGGGAGGGCTNKAGGGGGGGAYTTTTLPVSYGNSYNYVVGTGGVGAATAGPAGGASSFNAVCVANGGAGGGLGTTTDGAGGIGGTGTYAGGNGAAAVYATGSGGGGGGAGSSAAGGNASGMTGGTGGATGGGAGAAGRNTNGNGAAGSTLGGGGSGAKNTGGAKLGGNGADGQVKITYTINCLAPAAQPTQLILTPGATSVAGAFTASATADGYLVVQTTSSSAPSSPVDGTTYTAGNSALGGTIVYAGVSTSFTSGSLTGGTTYWYWVYAYNNSPCVGGIKYLAASPLSDNNSPYQFIQTYSSSTTWTCPYGVTTVVAECWGGGGAGGGTVAINRSGGGGDGGEYKLGTSAAVTAGTSYTVTVGTGGTGTTGTGATGNASVFLSTTGNGGVGATGGTSGSNGNKGPKAPAGTFKGGDGGAGSNTASGGGGGGAGSSAAATNAGAAPGHGLGGAPDGGDGALSVTISGNGNTGNSIGGGGSGALSLNGTSYIGGSGADGQVRLTYSITCTAPPAQATSLSLTASATSVAGSFTASANTDGWLVIRTATASAPTNPSNGTTYFPGSSVLGGYVESTGTATSFTSSSLTTGNTYWYWVYSYNKTSCNGGITYRTASPLSGSTTLSACAAPTNQPTTLVLSGVYANLLSGSFTASSPAASGYLVVRTTTASAPTNPTNGTTYTAGSSALGGYIESAGASTTFTSTSLTASTTYWYWVYAYNNVSCYTIAYKTTSPLSNSTTTAACGATNSASLPQTGSTNFTALTWSLGHTPTACENAQLTFTGTGATDNISIVNVTGTINVNNLSLINNSTASSNKKTLKFLVNSGASLNVGGNLTMTSPSSNTGDTCILYSAGTTTVTGNAVIGAASGDAGPSTIGSYGTTSNQTFIFKGDLTFNAKSYTADQYTVMIMDGTGTQTITNNTNTSPYTDAVLFETLKIGNGTNTPTVTFAGSNTHVFLNDKGGSTDITAGSTLIIPAGYTLNAEDIVSAGVYNSSFYLRAGSFLKIAGNTGGPTGSNFPYHFSSYSLNATGTVDYNGSNAITQTVYNGVTYGKLALTNGSGSGRAAKNTTSAITTTGTINVNALADLTLGSTVSAAGTFTVANTGALYCAANVVSGAGAFTLSSGASLGIGHLSGISSGSTASGNIQMTGGRSFNSGATYIYNGAASQVTGNGFPATLTNLTLNNANTVTLTTDLSITGAQVLSQGILDLGTNKLTVTGNGTLSSTGGKIKANTGILEMNGSSGTEQTLAGSWFVNRNISTLINSNTRGIIISATAGDTLLVSSALLFGPTTTNSTITTNNNLTLLSRDTATARFGEIKTGSGNAISGSVTVERYIKSGRKWRLLSWPGNSSQTAKQSWMEGAASANANPTPGFGMIITDGTNNWAANGFDSKSASGPTVKYWDASTNSFIAIPNANSYAMNSQTAYYCYVRGDRSCLPSPATLAPTILRSTGTLKTGNQVMSVSANLYTAIGNPYASSIDLRGLDTTNITGNFYLWDPNLTGAYGLGAYQTVYKSGTDYRIMPGGGSYTALNSVIDTIESGQAFFVKGRSSAGSVTFKESAKSSGVRTQSRTGSTMPEISCLLSIVNGATTSLADGAMTMFDAAYSDAVDDDDVDKMTNTSENVSFKRENHLLAIERRQNITANDTLFLNISGTSTHSYQWDITADNLADPLRTAVLIDNYLGTETPLNLSGVTTISFSTNGTPGTYAANRFKIVFRQAAVVPVRFTSVSAVRNADKTATVIWKTENEINMQDYTIDRSTDGRSFTAIGTQLPRANNGGSASYPFNDVNASSADNYYRVRGNSLNGQRQYTAIVKVGPLSENAEMSIYPNPVTGGLVNLRLQNQPKGSYTIKVTNSIGQAIHTESAASENNNTTVIIQLDANTAPGAYRATVTGASGKATTIPFIIK